MERVTVLHVDDEPSFVDLVSDFLQRENERINVVTRTNPEDGLSLLGSQGNRIDCIVSDYEMPRTDGIEFLADVREMYPDLPFILYTGKGSEEVASEAISEGATDYLQKQGGTDQYELLANRIGNAVEQYRSNQRATNLERIRGLASDINQALVRATSIEEIESKVCQLIGESAPYAAACISRVNQETMRVEPQTWAGDAAGYFEALEMSIDERAPGRQAPDGQAFHDREIAISQDIETDARYATWREAALKRGFRSLAVVPIEYEDELHGLLTVFASRPDFFDRTEQDLLVELGDDIAHALHRQSLQTELKQTNAELGSIMRQVPVGLILMRHDDGSFRYQRFNPRMEDLSGLSSEEIRNKTPQEVLGPEDGAAVTDRYRECVEQKESIAYTSEFQIAGENVIRKGIVTPVTEDGEVEQLVVVVQDVTEERRRQEQLKRTTARLKALFDNSPDMINVHDTEGNIIDPNPKLCEKTGYDKDELTEMKVWELDQTVNQAELLAVSEEMDIGEIRRFESELQRKDGSSFPTEVHIRRLDLAGVDRYVATSRDITERKRSERKRRQIISRMNDAVVETDPDWEITLVNGRAEEFLGRTESELIGRDFWAVFAEAEETRFEEVYRQVMETRDDASIVDYYPSVDEWFDIQVYPNEDGGLAFYFRRITEYKKRERELQRVERRYQAIFEDPNILAGVLDTDGTLLEQNQTAMEYIDAEIEDILGRPFWETPWWPEDIRPMLRKKVERAASGEYVTYEVDLTKPDGEPYSVSGVIRPVTDEDDNIVSLVVSASDITERRQSERQFRALVEYSKDSISIIDTDGRFQYQSPSIEQILGYDPGEPIGDEAWEYIHPEDRERVKATFEEWIDNPGETELIEYRARHADGSWRWMEARGNNQFDNPDIEGYIVNSRDITDRKERERELQTLKRQYQTLAENFPDGAVFLFDSDYRYLRVRGSELEAVGLSPDGMEGSKPHDLFSEDIADELVHYYEAALNGEKHTFEQEYGSNRYRVQTVPIETDAQHIDRGMAVAKNINDQVERRHELEQRNERLEEFASIVSHDLRNPLRVAQGELELATKTSESSHLTKASKALDRCEELIQDILTLAREGERVGEPESVTLAALVEEVWQTIETTRATIDIDAEQTIEADVSRLRQLLENILTNAIEHGGSDVTVTVGRLDNGFYIEDDGPGVPDAKRDEIFTAGYTTAGEGTGFGLRIAEQVATAHGWQIRVTDSPTGGARFEVTGVTIITQ
jgi:PAS domain S-box-containing protein